MKKWEIVMSKDGNDIDAVEIAESENEPGFWECYEIAEKHGCELWYVDEIVEDE